MPAPIGQVDEALLQWATPREHALILAANRHGSVRAAAREIGIDSGNATRLLQRLARRAALKGYSPAHDMTRVVPDPYIVKGVSTYYNKEGKPAGQWVKSRIDEERALQAMRDAIAALTAEVAREKPARPPAWTDAALCNLYTMTDLHVGMRAWAKETGAPWDIDIAETTITRAFDYLIERSASADTAIVAQLGDFLHFDGLSAVTPTNQHPLDADSRYSKVVQSAVRILRHVVRSALRKHGRVVLLIAEGNHDPAGAVWMRHLFRALYEGEPRIECIDSELPYYCHQHGATMIGWHHGHLSKPDALPLLFAAQFPQAWGTSRHRYVHCGHMHHVYEQEHNGVTVIQHPTLAARDAYAARGGWIAERQITGITYHAEHGQVARVTVTPEMLTEAAPPAAEQPRRPPKR